MATSSVSPAIPAQSTKSSVQQNCQALSGCSWTPSPHPPQALSSLRIAILQPIPLFTKSRRSNKISSCILTQDIYKCLLQNAQSSMFTLILQQHRLHLNAKPVRIQPQSKGPHRSEEHTSELQSRFDL